MCTDHQLSQLVQLTNGADSQVAQVVVNYVRENITEAEVGQSRQVFVDQMAAHISYLVSACITHCLPRESVWRLGSRISSSLSFLIFLRMVWYAA